jgi:hypothetical protein
MPGFAGAAAGLSAREIELQEIERHKRRFRFLTIATIVVSFVHMVTALLLYSGPEWYEQLATCLMTLLIDVATWVVASYLDYALRKKLARSAWVKRLFLCALAISGLLNFSYIYAKMPKDDVVPTWISVALAVFFGFFIPACIGVASLAVGELDDDRTKMQMADADERSLLGQLQSQVAQLLTLKAQWEADAERTRIEHQLQIAALKEQAIEQQRLQRAEFERQLDAWKQQAELATNKLAGVRAARKQPPILPSHADPTSGIQPEDVASVIAACLRANLTVLKKKSDLMEVCGWDSFLIPPRAYDALAAAGRVRPEDGQFVLLDEAGHPYGAPHKRAATIQLEALPA